MLCLILIEKLAFNTFNIATHHFPPKMLMFISALLKVKPHFYLPTKLKKQETTYTTYNVV